MRKNIQFSALLALIAVLLFSTLAHAWGGPVRFSGRWIAIDKFDGSTINMTLAGGRGGPFRVTWTESSFVLCDDTGQGLGRGSAEISGANTLYLELDIECFRTDATAHFETELNYDPVSRTLDPVDESSGATLFSRPGGP